MRHIDNQPISLTPDISSTPGATTQTPILPFATSSVFVTVVANVAPYATVSATLNGTEVDLGQPLVLVNFGSEIDVLVITVLARDGSTSGVYTINIRRAAPSTNPFLESLMVTGTGLEPMPTFNRNTISYTINAIEGSDLADFSFSTENANATVRVFITNRNGTRVEVPSSSGSGQTILTAGSNALIFEVMAEDGSTERSYTVTIIVAEDGDDTVATLMALDVFGNGSVLSLSPEFEETGFDYTVEFSRFLSELSLTINAFPAGRGWVSSATLNGYNIDINSAIDIVNLDITNTIVIRVSSYNDQHHNYYTIKVLRELPPDSPTQLTVPTGISVSNTGVVSWGEVTGAIGYIVVINNIPQLQVSVAEFVISPFILGIYNITVQAIGCGEWYATSAVSDVFIHEQRGRLDTPVNLHIEGSVLTWMPVADAYSYEIQISGITEVFVSNVASFDLSFLTPGSRTIRVRAIADSEESYLDNSLDSAELGHTVSAVLISPDIVAEVTVNRDGNRIFWNRIENAVGYYLYIDGYRQAISITGRQVVLDLPNGQYEIQIRARGDGVIFLDSGLSNALFVTIEDSVIVCSGCGEDPCECVVVEYCEVCEEHPCVCEGNGSEGSGSEGNGSEGSGSGVVPPPGEGGDDTGRDTFDWPGFPGALMPWRYPDNFYPWFFWGLGLLLLLILLVVIPVVVIKKKRRSVDDGSLDECRGKGRDAINQAFCELKQAGELVTACDIASNPDLEKEAMLQLAKTDAAMTEAEAKVETFLKVKKQDKKKAK